MVASESFVVEVGLVNLVVHHFHLICLALAQHHGHLVTSAVEVGVVYSEIAEELLLTALDS